MSITIRDAGTADIDALLEVRLASFPGDESWHYRYPYYREFPEDHAYYSKLRMEEKLADAVKGSKRVMLAEAPSNEDPEVIIPVALAIWVMPGWHTEKPQIRTTQPEVKATTTRHSPRRDTNQARVKTFTSLCHKAKVTYFDEKYGDDQLYLNNIGTHPDYGRRGAATALVEWGVNFAEKKQIPLSLFASSMGKQLYTKLGFQALGTITVQADADPAKVKLVAMIKTPENLVDATEG